MPAGPSRLAQRGPHIDTPAAWPAPLPAGAPFGDRKRDPAHQRRDRDQLGVGELGKILARQALGAGSQEGLLDVLVRMVVAVCFLPLLGAGIPGLVQAGLMLLGGISF